MGAKVCGSLRRQGLGEQCLKIGLENAPCDAAVGTHQFDNVLGERRKVIKRRQWIKNDPKRLSDSFPFPVADMSQNVVNVRMIPEDGDHRLCEFLKIEFEDVAGCVAEYAGLGLATPVREDQGTRARATFGLGEETSDDALPIA